MPACYIPTKINSQDMKFLQNLTKSVGLNPNLGLGNITSVEKLNIQVRIVKCLYKYYL